MSGAPAKIVSPAPAAEGSVGIDRYYLLIIVAVALVAMAVYANTLSSGFVWDDLHLMKGPTPIKSLQNIPNFFTSSSTAGMKLEGATPYYRPLTILSLAMDYAIWGENPTGYHLTNMLLHGLVSVLVFFVSRKLFASTLTALLAALVFALHPVHGEAVAYISARNDMVCTLFMTASFYCYLLYGESRKAGLYPLAVALFFCSLLAKEMSITLPVLILLYELLLSKRGVLNACIRTIPFVAAALVFLVIRYLVLAMPTWESPPLAVRLATAPGVIVQYLKLLLCPFGLKVFYDVPVTWTFTDPHALLSALVLVAVCIASFFLLARNKAAFFAVAWTAITLLPVSAIPAFIQPALVAERYLYVPSVGFSLAVGGLIAWLVSGAGRPAFVHRFGRHFPTAFAVALCIVFAVATFSRNKTWQNQLVFSQAMISAAPQHPLGYFVLGNWYGENGKFAEMAGAYQKSVYYTAKRQNGLGNGYLGIGAYAHAEAEYAKLMTLGAGNGETFNNYGVAQFYQGRVTLAVEAIRKSAALEPANPGFSGNLKRLQMHQPPLAVGMASLRN